jgi:hypothetical protein
MMLMTPLTAFAPHMRGARTADDFDAVDVFQHHVLHVPVHAGEQRRIDGAAVDQHQQLVLEGAAEAARRDRIVARIDARHLAGWAPGAALRAAWWRRSGGCRCR